MAQVNQEIRLSAVDKTGAELKRVQSKLEKITALAQNIAIGSGKAAAGIVTPIAKRNINEYVRTLGVLDKRLGGLGGRLSDVAKAFDFGGKTVVGVAGINALSSALKDLPGFLGGANETLQTFASTLSNITAPVNTVTDAIQNLGPTGVATAGGIAAATAALMAYAPALRNAGKAAEGFAESFRGTIEVTQDIISEKTLRSALAAATAEQKKLSAGTAEYSTKTEEVLAIQRELTAELRRQETVLNMVNSAQIEIANTVRRNINASRQARKASGFAEFSQAAGSQTAIDKSIRRQREKLARAAQKATGPAQAAAAPLMLPSSEMLKAAERGILRIGKAAEVFPKIGKEVDRTARTNNTNIRAFIDGLRRGNDVASKLPQIFQVTQESLSAINSLVQRKTKLLDLSAKNNAENNYSLRLQLELMKQLSAAAVEQLNTTKQQLQQDRERRKEAIRRRDAIRDIRKRRRQQFVEDLQLGAGFPLLTGQGPGGVLGGLAGALASQGRGGFGSQIFFSAVGAQLDALGGRAIELGQALDPLSGDIDAIADAAGLASTSTKAYLTALKGQVSDTELAAVAAETLAVVVGKDGVDALRNLGDESTRLGQEASKAFSAIAAALAPLLTGVIAPLATGIERLRLLSRANELGKEDPAIAKAAKERQEVLFRAVAPGDVKALQQRDEDRIRVENTLLGLIRKREAADAAAVEARINGLGADRIGLQILKNEGVIRKANNDLTDKNVQDAKLSNLFLEKRLELNKLNNNESLTGAQRETQYAKIIQTFENKKTALANSISDAKKRSADEAAREAKQVERAAETEARRAKRLQDRLTQEGRAADNVTTSLENSLALLQVSGSVEEQRRKILQDYEATLVRIAELKNQDNAAVQTQLADDIKRLSLAQLESKAEAERVKNIQNAIAPIKDLREKQEANLRTTKEYNRLLMEGVLPSEAERIVNFNEQVRIALLLNKLAIQRAYAEGLTNEALKERLEALEKERRAIEGEAAKGPGEALPDKAPKDIIAERVGQLKEELKELTNIGNIVVKGADSIGAAFSTAFQEVVSGSKSAQQALADMFRSVADDFLRMAAEIIAKQLIMIALQTLLQALGGAAASSGSASSATSSPVNTIQDGGTFNLPGKIISLGGPQPAANGGPVKSGNPYLIGERGPELFVPRSNGRIVPNGRFGGGGGGDVNVVVNVDAKGSNAQGSDRDAKALGSAIGIAVRSELVKQKRPGGLLAS